eukprot:4695295-Pyramimonas_sp.AAC.1
MTFPGLHRPVRLNRTDWVSGEASGEVPLFHMPRELQRVGGFPTTQQMSCPSNMARPGAKRNAGMDF